MPALPKLRALVQPNVHGTLSTLHVFHNNVRIGALGRAGKLDAARQLFDRMPSRDVVSWNAILTAHWQNRDLQGSMRLFASMPERNVVSWNSMIAGCLDNSEPDAAFGYFSRMPQRNAASWNAMISGFVRYGRLDRAEELFEEMPAKNVISYTAMLGGFAQNGEIEKARQLFDRMPKRNVVSWAAIISGYVENGMFLEARSLFDQMPEKNVVAYTAMVTGFCKEGNVESARNIFDGIQIKDLISWNAMISGYVHNGHGEEALKLHKQMLRSGIKPDHTTLTAVVTACSALALLQQGRLTHAVSIKTRLESNISLCNSLITMYSKCGNIFESELVFQSIKHKDDIVSWNTIIAAFAQHGHYENVLSLFHEMQTNGSTPNSITFLSVLSACGHVGKVDDSIKWFSLMESYGLPPKSEHYACLVDILCRAGEIDKACEYIRAMPFEAEGSLWGAILGACQMYPNVCLGEVAAEKYLQLDGRNSGVYVMLSNIYAASSMWRDVNRVRGLMKEHGVKKQPGYSWTEIADKVHMFLVGDASHPEIGEVKRQLDRIYLHMQMAAADTDMTTEMVDPHWYCFS